MSKRNTCIIFLSFFFWLLAGFNVAIASETDGTIPANSYAWGENIGWINFGASNSNIHVTDSAVTGYAWSSTYGWINFSPTNGGVTNTPNGVLRGHAWSSALGWIPFTGVTINTSGKFTGMAGTAGSTAGRINFDCTNCNITTDWRPALARTSSPTSTTTTTVTSATPTPTTTAIAQASGTGGTPTTASPKEQTPPLFDIEVGPGSLESTKKEIPILAIIAATVAMATALIAFYVFKRRKKRTDET